MAATRTLSCMAIRPDRSSRTRFVLAVLFALAFGGICAIATCGYLEMESPLAVDR